MSFAHNLATGIVSGIGLANHYYPTATNAAYHLGSAYLKYRAAKMVWNYGRKGGSLKSHRNKMIGQSKHHKWSHRVLRVHGHSRLGGVKPGAVANFTAHRSARKIQDTYFAHRFRTHPQFKHAARTIQKLYRQKIKPSYRVNYPKLSR